MKLATFPWLVRRFLTGKHVALYEIESTSTGLLISNMKQSPGQFGTKSLVETQTRREEATERLTDHREQTVCICLTIVVALTELIR